MQKWKAERFTEVSHCFTIAPSGLPASSKTLQRRVSTRSSAAAAAAKSLQSCPTLCDPIDSSPPGSPIPGILQARTLEWVAISFSSAWKWKWSRSVVSDSSQPHGLQPTRLLHPWDFPGKSTGVGCHCLLWLSALGHIKPHEYLHFSHNSLGSLDCHKGYRIHLVNIVNF